MKETNNKRHGRSDSGDQGPGPRLPRPQHALYPFPRHWGGARPRLRPLTVLLQKLSDHFYCLNKTVTTYAISHTSAKAPTRRIPMPTVPRAWTNVQIHDSTWYSYLLPLALCHHPRPGHTYMYTCTLGTSSPTACITSSFLGAFMKEISGTHFNVSDNTSVHYVELAQ